jgi:hypothetical protein
MKKFIAITILSIMLIVTGENDCEQYTSQEACEGAHPDDIYCIYRMYMDGDGEEGKQVYKCNQIINQDDCQYDANKYYCFVKAGKEEPDGQACQMLGGQNEGEEICGLGPASCYHYRASRDKCLLLENCGYDEKKDEYSRCFMIDPEHNDPGCSFNDNKCTSDSNQKFCYLVDDQGYTFCRSKNIQCSDLDQDSSNCPKADLQDSAKKCSYDSSRSSGNRCFEGSLKDTCSYDSANKKC